ncbi:hypothetical protein GCM10010172_30330 [Paractinoplanes ferrugineus]|uniref:Uncharacterized protein n=1 Tax=Paractinoplanes ferrugineus TaxID=113564 RepID=A0A919J4D7_9ACTN|nr:hypothetical protein [Actinoplanes ferrugineus]GIE14275.1 hypothetical protein Afe05nite_61150 [Actinoplanes ferrugineus]
MGGPLARWSEDTCAVCPAQALGPGAFDVVARPSQEIAYDRQIGWRVDQAGTAVCVHPYRVGLPPGRYASAAEPLPASSTPTPEPPPEALDLPEDLIDLEGWLVATLRVVDQDRIFGAVARAEREAAQRFAPGEVVTALRRVLSVELARR